MHHDSTNEVLFHALSDAAVRLFELELISQFGSSIFRVNKVMLHTRRSCCWPLSTSGKIP